MIKRLLISILAAGLLGLAGRYVYMELEQESICSICHRAIHEGTSFLIYLQDGHTEEVCCPRCGLRFMKGRDDIADVEAADFYSGERLPARQAFYVEGSSVHPCCKDIAEKISQCATVDGAGIIAAVLALAQAVRALAYVQLHEEQIEKGETK